MPARAAATPAWVISTVATLTAGATRQQPRRVLHGRTHRIGRLAHVRRDDRHEAVHIGQDLRPGLPVRVKDRGSSRVAG